ncbi:hypothetical protein [Nostoc sp.]|uniref:hypothetical protein n=1 Tax=Nostoc sp. TaxID=1180 RepID=UPI002FFC3872
MNIGCMAIATPVQVYNLVSRQWQPGAIKDYSSLQAEAKTILKYSHEKRSDRLILASVQQIMLGHLPENRFVHN